MDVLVLIDPSTFMLVGVIYVRFANEIAGAEHSCALISDDACVLKHWFGYQ